MRHPNGVREWATPNDFAGLIVGQTCAIAWLWRLNVAVQRRQGRWEWWNVEMEWFR